MFLSANLPIINIQIFKWFSIWMNILFFIDRTLNRAQDSKLSHYWARKSVFLLHDDTWPYFPMIYHILDWVGKEVIH